MKFDCCDKDRGSNIVGYYISENKMSNKQHLKPLNHKKIVNNIEPIERVPLTKDIKDIGKPLSQNSTTPKPALSKKSSNGETIKPVQYQRSG